MKIEWFLAKCYREKKGNNNVFLFICVFGKGIVLIEHVRVKQKVDNLFLSDKINVMGVHLVCPLLNEQNKIFSSYTELC